MSNYSQEADTTTYSVYSLQGLGIIKSVHDSIFIIMYNRNGASYIYVP